jgi:hypothetical protein
MNQRGQATRIEDAGIGSAELVATTTCATSLFAHESTRVQIIAKRAPSTAENIDVQRVGDDVSIILQKQDPACTIRRRSTLNRFCLSSSTDFKSLKISSARKRTQSSPILSKTVCA